MTLCWQVCCDLIMFLFPYDESDGALWSSKFRYIFRTQLWSVLLHISVSDWVEFFHSASCLVVNVFYGRSITSIIQIRNPTTLWAQESDDWEILGLASTILPQLATLAVVVETFHTYVILSFLTGIFPDGMKIAKVIPIYKNGREI